VDPAQSPKNLRSNSGESHKATGLPAAPGASDAPGDHHDRSSLFLDEILPLAQALGTASCPDYRDVLERWLTDCLRVVWERFEELSGLRVIRRLALGEAWSPAPIVS
jgi:hypothetical protein